MSVKVTALVWERSKASGATLLVLLALADYGDDNGENIRPRQATLARKARQTERNIRNILRELQDLGELEWAQTGRAAHYRVVIEALTPEKISGQTGTVAPIRSEKISDQGGNDFRSDRKPSADQIGTVAPVAIGSPAPIRSETQRRSKEPLLNRKSEPLEEPPAEPPAAAAAISAWEDQAGSFGAMVYDAIVEDCEKHGVAQVVDAIKEASLAGSKSWKYVAAILRRWESEGRGRTRSANTHAGSTQPTFEANRERYAGGQWGHLAKTGDSQ